MQASMTPNAQPASSARYPVIDGLRGLMLVLMVTGHFRIGGGTAVQTLHPGVVSFLDAAFGFVLLSGVVTGFAYGRVMRREGFAVAASRLLRRALVLYFCAAGLILTLVAAAQVLPGAEVFWAAKLGPLARPDAGALIAAGLLLQHVNLADILAPYVVYLLLSPLVIFACLRGRTGWALGLSGALWLTCQFGLTGPVTLAMQNDLTEVRPDLFLPRVFNLAAWQFLFVLGLAIGARTLVSGPKFWRRALPVRRLWPALLVVTLVAGFAALRLAMQLRPDLHTWTLLAPFGDKARLGVLALVNLGLTAWLLAWVTIAAPNSASRAVAATGGLCRGALRTPALRLLGRHSLAVYIWHVVLMYAVVAADAWWGPFGESTRTLILAASIALLVPPALLLEHGKVRLQNRASNLRLRPAPSTA